MQNWEQFLNVQETVLGKETVNRWLRTLRVADFDAGNIYLEAQDSFQVLWFEEHIRTKINDILRNENNRKIKVHLSIAGEKASKKPPLKHKTAAKSPKMGPQVSLAFDSCDPTHTFHNFVLSPANALPADLLFKLCGYSQIEKNCNPNRIKPSEFNPIYICGMRGSGKTHLLSAVAHALTTLKQKIAFVRAETFTEHLVSAIRAGEMHRFRQNYRTIDALIIDDVHGFSQKWATQEELFHTFNALHLEQKTIILSANCPPSQLESVEPRLVSRFEWGIVLPLETLAKEELALAVNQKALALQFPLNQRVASFLVDTFTSSSKAAMQALEALIIRLHASQNTNESRLSSTQVTITHAEHLLNDLIQHEQKNAIHPETIVQITAELFGIRKEDILGKAQSRDCVMPRQLAMYLCRTELKLPFTKIASLFSKDHSTVMSSVKVIQKALDRRDPDISFHLSILQKKIRE